MEEIHIYVEGLDPKRYPNAFRQVVAAELEAIDAPQGAWEVFASLADEMAPDD